MSKTQSWSQRNTCSRQITKWIKANRWEIYERNMHIQIRGHSKGSGKSHAGCDIYEGPNTIKRRCKRSREELKADKRVNQSIKTYKDMVFLAKCRTSNVMWSGRRWGYKYRSQPTFAKLLKPCQIVGMLLCKVKGVTNGPQVELGGNT